MAKTDIVNVMKKAAKAFVVSILAWQVRRLRKKHHFKVVAVVGSVGKTSTKFAISHVLGESLRVRYQAGNYNDIVSVPLIFFGRELPSLLNPVAWILLFLQNETTIGGDYPYDVVVVELGTDGPGQIAAFKKYLTADIAVVTALTPEHMEFFNGLNSIADEELSVATFSKLLIINADLCPDELLQDFDRSFLSYSLHKDSTYHMDDITYKEDGCEFNIRKDRQPWLHAGHSSFSEPQLYSLTAAAAIANMLELTNEAIISGFEKIEPIAGRMQRLNGINGSVILDDTYNASPEAVKAAVDTLYRLPGSQKIALLGNMNELGTFSETAHTEIGSHCDPKQLSLLVTLGPDSNKYLAAAAEKNGCNVKRFDSPYEAGKYIATLIKPGALVLIKGSQNRVFAEEATKQLLADPKDVSKLVRQSAGWLKKKAAQFGPAEEKKTE